MASHKSHLVATQNLGTSLLGNPVIPPYMVKWIGIRSKHPLETKRIECTYSKVLTFEDQSDTYHDTQTHYLMEQDPLLLQD